MTHLIAAVTPESADWKYLGASVHDLNAGESYPIDQAARESAVVLVEGSILVEGAGLSAEINRAEPFSHTADLTYVPPRAAVTITAQTASQIAIGTAPAEGRFPPRIVSRTEMTSVLRGGGPATRQVVASLEDLSPAESLIVYEAWVPRGCWTGWPPHRHDGVDGSPYLEETYYYRFDRRSGFGMHRNFARDLDLNDCIAIRDQSLITVPAGFHLCGVGPAANVWLLNFLAGTSVDRTRPPLYDSDETWISDDWGLGLMQLPAVGPD
jgi:5-deoxy-glucuronate isomerase